MYRSLTVIVPVKDEEETVGPFLEAILPVLKSLEATYSLSCFLLFVDDGSNDLTVANLVSLERKVPTTIVSLTRGFGKEAALTAGLAHAETDAVISMDVDLQDPVELLPRMVEAWLAGAEVVTGVRDDRSGDALLGRIFAKSFYHLFNMSSPMKITPNAGDFRLLDKKVVKAILALPERVRFNKGLFAWVGFREIQLQHVRSAGVGRPSRWRFFKLLQFALDGLFSFSPMPARIWTFLGIGLASVSLLYGVYIVLRTIFFGTDLPGYPSLMAAILFIGSLNMVGLGILGEYVVRIFLETKQRPLYLVREVRKQNFDSKKNE